MFESYPILKSQTVDNSAFILVGHLHVNKQGQTITVDKYRVVRTDTM